MNTMFVFAIGPRLARTLALNLALLVSASLPASAGLIFNFSDNGNGTTLVTGSGSALFAGSAAAQGLHRTFIGWDDHTTTGPLIADSAVTTFSPANLGGGFQSYSATLGGSALNLNGVNLDTTQGIWLDGAGASYPFFVLAFSGELPQSGAVSASGTATVNVPFSVLPYASGSSVDIKGDGSVLFTFGPASVPDLASTAFLMVLAAPGLAVLRRLNRRS